MSFDLTNKNIQDTFQNLLQQTGSNGEVYDLEGNRVTNINIGTISSSAVTASVVEIPNSSDQSGNKLHSRSGTLYFGDTNLASGGGGITNVVEDTTPQLGGNLDLNGNDLTGTGNFLIQGTGSLGSVNVGGDTYNSYFSITPTGTIMKDFFLIKSGSFNALNVNQDGVLNLGGFSTEPSVIEGGFYYNTDENEFYLGTG